MNHNLWESFFVQRRIGKRRIGKRRILMNHNLRESFIDQRRFSLNVELQNVVGERALILQRLTLTIL